MPPEINLGGQYPVKTLLPVLRHLCAYLAPVPPQRRHDRHRVRHQMQVLHGRVLVNSFVVFSKEFGGQSLGLQPDSWQVDNVSRGGFGVVLNEPPKDWLRVGALLALQPAGGENCCWAVCGVSTGGSIVNRGLGFRPCRGRSRRQSGFLPL